ncbi:MAG: response regulator, partial [Cyanobacteria bacterium J06559_1]
AALTEKGNPILILDVADLLDSATTWAASNSGNAIAIDTAMGLTESKIPDIDESTSSSAAVTAPQKRILVVDDSMTVRAMEKKLLQNKGYAVDVAINGVEGWRALRMHTYDLVVTDVDMPRMNGIELIEKIRAHRTTQKLPVIVVSYKDRAEDQLAGLKAGANYYLTKSSFHDDGLVTAVVDLIGTSHHTKS